jgi:hypothetical protein
MFRSILFLLIAMACASVAAADMFEYKWKAPDAQPLDSSGKKVAVLVQGKDRLASLAAEQSLAADVTARGRAKAIAAHSFVSEADLSDKEKLKALFLQEGISGVVLIQGETKGKVPLDPNVWKDKSFWGAYGIKSGSSNDAVSSQKDVKLYVQTKIYSLEQDKLIWVGTSQTKVSQIDEFIKKLVPSVAKEMTKQGLLQNK